MKESAHVESVTPRNQQNLKEALRNSHREAAVASASAGFTKGKGTKRCFIPTLYMRKQPKNKWFN